MQRQIMLYELTAHFGLADQSVDIPCHHVLSFCDLTQSRTGGLMKHYFFLLPHKSAIKKNTYDKIKFCYK